MALNELKKQAAGWSFYDSSYVNELLEYFPRQKKDLKGILHLLAIRKVLPSRYKAK